MPPIPASSAPPPRPAGRPARSRHAVGDGQGDEVRQVHCPRQGRPSPPCGREGTRHAEDDGRDRRGDEELPPERDERIGAALGDEVPRRVQRRRRRARGGWRRARRLSGQAPQPTGIGGQRPPPSGPSTRSASVRSAWRERHVSIACVEREHDVGVVDLGPPRRVGGEVEAPPGAVAELHVGERSSRRTARCWRSRRGPTATRAGRRGDQQAAPVALPVGGVAPPRRLLAAQERREREAVALRRDVDAHRLAQRRDHVDVLGEASTTVPWAAGSRGSRTMPRMW